MIYISLLASSLLAGQEDMQSLKEQLKAQQKTIAELMQRLDRIENNQETNIYVENEATTEYVDTMSQPAQINASFNQNAYIPDIGLILNSSIVSRNIDNQAYPEYGTPGYILPGEAELPYNKDRGFNFNYAEVSMYSAVDPYFDAFAIFHMEADSFEIDEGYVTTRDLDYGLRVKAGKFKSAIGRYNELHQHAWDFSEQTLLYSNFFGPEGLSDPGVQLQWVAPTSTYLMVGVEAMQGTNEQSFGYEKGNSLYNTYVKTSLDLSDDTSVLAGVSFMHGKNTFDGDTNIYAADLTVQEQLSSYSSLAWQSEYMYRDMAEDSFHKRQDAMYSQLVYTHNQNYAGGVRFDALMKNNAGDAYANMYTAMIEYKPFEFSRLRLEYSVDESKYFDGQQKNVQQLMLELNVAVGAHSAHNF